MTRRPLVVIAGATFPDSTPTAQLLREIDADVVDAAGLSAQETARLALPADAVITDHFPVDAALIARLERCAVICRYGVGVDAVDLAAATRAGIVVTRVPDYCLGELADHALALLLAVARQIVSYDASVRAGAWDYNSAGVHRLAGKTLGLIGFGRIARGLLERVRPLGLRGIACDPYVDDEEIEACTCLAGPLDRVLLEADVVSLHAPLAPETRAMIGRDELRRMKRSAILINTARGGLIDQEALTEALRGRWIAGAGLDVLDGEPPAPDDPLLALDNVVLTPHAGHYSEESLLQVQQEAADEVIRALTGRELRYAVNSPEVSRR